MCLVLVAKSRLKSWKTAFFLTFGVAIALNQLPLNRADAATPETAPAALKQVLTQIDTAATNKNVAGVLQYYSPKFTHSDGLTRQTLEQSLTQLWKQHPQLTYRTELKSWQPIASGIQAETVTYITGTQTVNGQQLKLDASLETRHKIENNQIVRQDVIAENNRITSGQNPPSVKINLPSQVRPGQEFSFDAIVQEPLENDLLLGSVLEEPVTANGYLTFPTVDLELLSSGGVFKVGRAPKTPTSQWISAVLVRHGGITMVTQRLRVVDGK
ncbi:nuclear transport factor 2 family protein [Myxacorys almedinensis A]|uniref:Nuclear transport factor 2 family protein n=2 Tax=Myxacorys TaxID=2056239 RepID=A0A8J8CLJ6_9CYAN|nr:nuclear transport factor 2 family protein [Myxacorys almedinensis A]